MKKLVSVVVPSEALKELHATHTLALENQKLINEIKTNLTKEHSSPAKQIGITIFTSIILAIFFLALAGIIVMALCLSGHLSPLAMLLGTPEVIILALVACSIVSVVCAIALICLFIHSASENKITTK